MTLHKSVSSVGPIGRYAGLEDFLEVHKEDVRALAGAEHFSTKSDSPSGAIVLSCATVLSCAYFLSRALQAKGQANSGVQRPYVIHLLGATDEIELNFSGRFFSFLPHLLQDLSSEGESLPSIEVHCFNPEFGQTAELDCMGVRILKFSQRYTRAEATSINGAVDLVLLLNPGFESQPDSWIYPDMDAPLPYLCNSGVSCVVASYGLIDNETDKFVLECHGFEPLVADAPVEEKFRINHFGGPDMPSIGALRGDPIGGSVGGFATAWFDLGEYGFDLESESFQAGELFVDGQALDLQKQFCQALSVRLCYCGDVSWFDFGHRAISSDGVLVVEVDSCENLAYLPELRALVRFEGEGLKRVGDAELIEALELAYLELRDALGDYQHLPIFDFLTGMGLFLLVKQSGKVEMRSPKNNLPYESTQELMQLA